MTSSTRMQMRSSALTYGKVPVEYFVLHTITDNKHPTDSKLADLTP